MRLPLAIFLFTSFYAGEKLFTRYERLVGLLFGHELAQILDRPLQQVFIVGNDAHIPEQFGIHLYCSHNFHVLFKITNNR